MTIYKTTQQTTKQKTQLSNPGFEPAQPRSSAMMNTMFGPAAGACTAPNRMKKQERSGNVKETMNFKTASWFMENKRVRRWKGEGHIFAAIG